MRLCHSRTEQSDDPGSVDESGASSPPPPCGEELEVGVWATRELIKVWRRFTSPRMGRGRAKARVRGRALSGEGVTPHPDLTVRPLPQGEVKQRQTLIGYRSHPHPGPPHKGEGNPRFVRHAIPALAALVRDDTLSRHHRPCAGDPDPKSTALFIASGWPGLMPGHDGVGHAALSFSDGRADPG